MAAEVIPQSVNSDDNLRITKTATVADALKATALTAGVDLTYSLKTFNLNETQATVADPRLSLSQTLERPGRKSVTCEVQYVFGADDDVAAAELVEGTEGALTLRYSVPNETAWTAAQVADTFTYRAGSQRKDAPTENGVQTITQQLFVTGILKKDQAIVA